jgi:hypothetical protein
MKVILQKQQVMKLLGAISMGNRFISTENLIPNPLTEVQSGEKHTGNRIKQPLLCFFTEKGAFN